MSTPTKTFPAQPTLEGWEELARMERQAAVGLGRLFEARPERIDLDIPGHPTPLECGEMLVSALVVAVPGQDPIVDGLAEALRYALHGYGEPRRVEELEAALRWIADGLGTDGCVCDGDGDDDWPARVAGGTASWGEHMDYCPSYVRGYVEHAIAGARPSDSPRGSL